MYIAWDAQCQATFGMFLIVAAMINQQRRDVRKGDWVWWFGVLSSRLKLYHDACERESELSTCLCTCCHARWQRIDTHCHVNGMLIEIHACCIDWLPLHVQGLSKSSRIAQLQGAQRSQCQSTSSHLIYWAMSRQRGPDSESGEEAGDACSVHVFQRNVVQDGPKGKPWMPTCIHKMDACFAKCSKFDRGFVMFTLERNMLTTCNKGEKGPVSCNLPAFNSLLQARRETSIKCAQDALEVEEMETDDTPQVKKRKIKSSHEALVNPVISIPFPSCGEWPERQVNVLWGVKSSDLWVELIPANMKHLKCILKTDTESVRWDLADFT